MYCVETVLCKTQRRTVLLHKTQTWLLDPTIYVTTIRLRLSELGKKGELGALKDQNQPGTETTQGTVLLAVCGFYVPLRHEIHFK